MLVAYSATPQPAKGIPSYEAMLGTSIRTRIDYRAPNTNTSQEEKQMNKNNARNKEKMKMQSENSRTKEKKLLLGEYVLVKQEREKKWSTPYEPIFCFVCTIQGSCVIPWLPEVFLSQSDGIGEEKPLVQAVKNLSSMSRLTDIEKTQ